MNEEMQQAILMAQIQKKRALREQYLYAPAGQPQADSPNSAERSLSSRVMKNAMLLAIREKKNLFGKLEELRREAASVKTDTLFDLVLSWCDSIADTLECSVYELFIDDPEKQKKIISRLLYQLRQDGVDCWTDISIENNGSAAFSLPNFDVYHHMTENSSAEITLVFQKEVLSCGSCRYRLMLGDISRKKPSDLLPEHATVWEESQGILADYTEEVLSDLQSGWLLLRKEVSARKDAILQEAEKLSALASVIEAQPAGLNLSPVLEKEIPLLQQLRAEEQRDYARMPDALKDSRNGQLAKERILLLGGTVLSLQRILTDHAAPAESIQEAAYLLHSAGSQNDT